MADGENAPRLSAVIERQRIELARVRAGDLVYIHFRDRAAASLVAQFFHGARVYVLAILI